MPNLPFKPPPFARQRLPAGPRPGRGPRPSLAQRVREHLDRAPWFLISAVVHAAALLLFAYTVTDEPLKEVFSGTFQVRLIGEDPKAVEPAPEPPPPEPPPPEPPPKPVESPPPEPMPEPKPAPAAVQPKPAVDPAPAASKATPVLSVQGAKDPAPNPFASREPEARAEALRIWGGNPASEKSVDAGLDWLYRHQDPDTGSWIDGDPQRKLAPGLTGLALLAFFGKGHTHTDPGPYRDTTARGIAYLLGIQTSHGRFGEPYVRDGEPANRYLMYHQALATLAIAEAYALTRDPKLRDPVRRAVGFIERAQQDGGGWDYGDLRTGRNDTSVTGWQVMALKSAHAAGIDVEWQTLFGIMGHMENMTGPTGEVSYANRSPGVGRRGPGMVAVGLLCAQILGWPRDDETLVREADYLLDHLPEWSKINENNPRDLAGYLHTMYYWYYGTLATFNMGGRWWQEWNARFRDLLVAHQIHQGDRHGSWDPPEGGFDSVGGRVYTTAINVLSLEIYYRYLPLYRAAAFDAMEVLERAAKVRGSMGLRRRAVRLMTAFQTERARANLVAALDDPDPGLRSIARRALVDRRAEEVVPALLADLDAPTAFARVQALDNLARLGDKRFVPHYIRALADDEKVVRVRALSALSATTGDDLGFEPDAPPALRQAAVARWQEWWKAESEPLPPGGIRGMVLVVDPRTPDAVVLGVGRDQRVRRGLRFEVRRGDETVAIVQAEKVEPTLTVARIVERRGGEVREGDGVRSLPEVEVSRAGN